MSQVAERYAQAIFELGTEQGEADRISEQLQKIAALYADSLTLRTVLDNPMIEREKRDAILSSVADRLGVTGIAKNALRVLAVRRRLPWLPEVSKLLGRLSDEAAGVVRARVVGATPLSEAYLAQLRQVLEKQVQRQVVLESEADPSLIAGVMLRIGDNTIDGSVRGQLRELERELLQA